MTRSSAPAARRLRADAQRSVEAILDATLELVLTGGELNMAAIARAAGVSRVTLYTHFPTREALVQATVERALVQVNEVLAAFALEDGPAPEKLSQLLGSSWRVLDRYRNLYTLASTDLPASRLRALHRPVFGRLDKLVARGQTDGDFRTDLPREWLVACIYALMHQAAEEVNSGRLSARKAGQLVTATALSVLTG